MAPATSSSGKQSGRKPLMAGNWKMNNNHLEAIALVQKMAFALKDADYDAVDIAVIPPFTAIRSVQTLVDADRLAIQYGAQDVSQHASGAYTGEIAASMLAKLGCDYAVVGHSERRQFHAEDDAVVNAKAKAALAADITPILCIGEGLEVRKAGEHVRHCLTQLDGGLEKIPADQVRRTVIAYEPVWAIGTGEVATPQDAQEVCAAIRTRLAELYDGGLADEVRILYGGSVKSGNVAKLMAQDDVDGALVGGASLDPGEFVKICRYRDLPV
ncbi:MULTISPECIES: triose-phosphate isomerase [Actinomadura]|uniref:Triosephosphate isomerase n=1 Tax=Actinomadura geliboluensis TaxID=882440 RepID=A0A5S4GGT0_9ACTN|nr:triose-phosphate isomerase [Actinomadura geliboluensis]TMR32049.1 triose-phosphate isomerase [Actinomadura geliboluensis]